MAQQFSTSYGSPELLAGLTGSPMTSCPMTSLPMTLSLKSLKSFIDLVPSHIDSSNLWNFILLLGTALYRNHMIPDPQRSWNLKSLNLPYLKLLWLSTQISSKFEDLNWIEEKNLWISLMSMLILSSSGRFHMVHAEWSIL